MTVHHIPVSDIRRGLRSVGLVPAVGLSREDDGPGPAAGTHGADRLAGDVLPLVDTLGRALRDLRISVTDRCNFRCTYCMPKEMFGKDHRFLPHSALLSFEEIERVARSFVEQGVGKIRLTGGEPLLRKDIEKLVARLSRLQTPDGTPIDLALTTNGSLLRRKAAALKDAGLQRVTVSLDAIDDATFRVMNDVDFHVTDVLDGIDAALAAGLAPIKVNAVIKRGVNDHQIVAIARHFRHTPVVPRFIEYMDVGETNGWNLGQVMPSGEVLARLAEAFPLLPAARRPAGGTAEIRHYADGAGAVGTISSVTGAFCGDCTRARLSPEGKLFTCLFGTRGYDLRALLRDADIAADDHRLSTAVARIWHARGDRYSELRSTQPATGTRLAENGGAQAMDVTAEPDEQRAGRVEMSYIGG
ncbi:MAG: GTP 3',8-cyclase MoaA [Janthinobacterium lividum]